jgi:hypothetical protein
MKKREHNEENFNIYCTYERMSIVPYLTGKYYTYSEISKKRAIKMAE